MDKRKIDKLREHNPSISEVDVYKAHMFSCPNCKSVLIQDFADNTLANCYDIEGCKKSYWLKEVRRVE